MPEPEPARRLPWPMCDGVRVSLGGPFGTKSDINIFMLNSKGKFEVVLEDGCHGELTDEFWSENRALLNEAQHGLLGEDGEDHKWEEAWQAMIGSAWAHLATTVTPPDEW
jgi:hypothetical protein